MSIVSFNNYAKRAEKQKNNTQLAGRYKSQAKNEQLIILDIIKKLKIDPSDTVLDIEVVQGTSQFLYHFFVKISPQLITLKLL